MSEEDPKAPSGAIPPFKRRVIKSAQTAPEGSAAGNTAAPAQAPQPGDAPASSEAGAAPGPTPSAERSVAPIPKPEPLPAVRIESRPDGSRFMDARAPRRAYEDTRRRPERQQQSPQHQSPQHQSPQHQSPEARAAEMGMPRRPERTRQTFDDRPRAPRADAPTRDDRESRATLPDGSRRTAQTRDERVGKRSEPRSHASAEGPVEKRRAEVKPAQESALPPPPQKEPDSNTEIALAGAPPVRIKQAAPKKDKPKTGKEALAQKARDPRHARKKGGGATPGSARADADAAKAKAVEEEVEASESDEQEDADSEPQIPKRPSLWQRVVSLFRR